jgi:hypothetical protein
MDKVQKHNSFNTNTPSSESYRKNTENILTFLQLLGLCERFNYEPDFFQAQNRV